MTYDYNEAVEASTEYFNGNRMAGKVFVDKYALRNKQGELVENTPRAMHWRMAKEFARIERTKFKEPLTIEQIFTLFDMFSPIIPQGSVMYGLGNLNQYVSLSNCFVVEPPKDSYGGIMHTDECFVQISKRRGGVGTHVNNLRPNKSPTTNSSRSSTGIIPFVKRYSDSLREVAQNGRRGAGMIMLSVHHPESVVLWEPTEEEKEPREVIVDQEEFSFTTTSEWYNPDNIDFITCKYDVSKVTGVNITVCTTDEFMNAVENKTDYEQRWPIDPETAVIRNEVDASRCWDKIIKSAWQVAEPGIAFIDTIIRESIADCYSDVGFETVASNPCSEIWMNPNDSCRLMATNLFFFVRNPFTKDAYFDYKEFVEFVSIAQRLADDLVDLELESIQRIIFKIGSDPEDIKTKGTELELWKKIAEVTAKGRRTGIGPTALGDTLAALGIGYGTKKGIDTVDKIYLAQKLASYQSSMEMSKELGPFPIWDHEKEKDHPFLKRIQTEKIEYDGEVLIDGAELYKAIKKHGRRNIANITTAPCGTISLLAKLVTRYGSTSGIEPMWNCNAYTRRVKIIEGMDNTKVDFVDQNGDKWQEFKVYPASVSEWMDITGKDDIEKSPWFGNCAEDLNWEFRVKLQAAAQKHVDHSISSTVNLPNNTTPEEVSKIYMTAWKAGLKGITVYRDGCRSGVLVKNKLAPKPQHRPESLPCDVHHVKVRHKELNAKGDEEWITEEYFVLVGMHENQPYEVFAGKNGSIPENVKKAQVLKIRKHYKIVFDNEETINDVSELVTDVEESTARLISLLLRQNTEVIDIVKQMEKVQSGDMASFVKAISRVLKKYIPDGTIDGEKCPKCGESLIRQDGCQICSGPNGCGWSKCG